MEKRYQVFVSSTFADLQDERGAVIKTLMEMDCIPAGMELFPAADEEHWEFIKRVIDDCDYYLLIIGGRYGSTTEDGISYTEKEFDYAVESGLKVIAILHENPDSISVEKSEIDPALRVRLQAFREKVAKDRLVKFWSATKDLPGLVALNLTKTMKAYPAVGWVRADQAANEEVLTELNEVRKENASLVRRLREQQEASVSYENLASLDEEVIVNGTYSTQSGQRKWSCTLTWRDLFGEIAPSLRNSPNDSLVEIALKDALQRRENINSSYIRLEARDFQTVALQLKALGLVNIRSLRTMQGGTALFWSLTPRGEALMMEIRTIKANGDAS